MSQLAKSLAPNSRIREKLVIVSTVVHYKSDGRLYAYAPYAREIENLGRYVR